MTQALSHQLRKLLLRQLGSGEVARLEEAILTEDGVAERLREEEFDLIDDYVHGRLTSADRADVERNVLNTPERIETLRVARAFAAQRPPVKAADPTAARHDPAPLSRDPTAPTRNPTPPRRWTPQRSVPTAMLLAAALAAVALIPHWQFESPRPPITPSVPPSAEAAPAQIITLLTDLNRGASKPVVHLTSGTASVRLQAEVPGPPPKNDVSYSLRVNDAAARPLFEASHLSIHVTGPYSFVEVTLPAQALGRGARTILLTVDGAAGAAPSDYRWQLDTVWDGAPQKK